MILTKKFSTFLFFQIFRSKSFHHCVLKKFIMRTKQTGEKIYTKNVGEFQPLHTLISMEKELLDSSYNRPDFISDGGDVLLHPNDVFLRLLLAFVPRPRTMMDNSKTHELLLHRIISISNVKKN